MIKEALAEEIKRKDQKEERGSRGTLGRITVTSSSISITWIEREPESQAAVLPVEQGVSILYCGRHQKELTGIVSRQ